MTPLEQLYDVQEICDVAVTSEGQHLTQDAVTRTLNLICPDASVAVCALHQNGRMEYAFFDSHAQGAAWVRRLPSTVKGVYVVMNPHDKRSSGEGITAKDVIRLVWLLIDCDPRRERGSNATDRERQLARDITHEIKAHLTSFGWPLPIEADSGNGAHLLYAIDLPNDTGSTKLLNGVLKYLKRFNTSAVEVDQSTGDPNQITKLYGTIARKGPATAERPHRLSAITSVPVVVTPVSLAALHALCPADQGNASPSSTESATKGLYDLGAILAKVEVFRQTDKGDYTEYQIRCPWSHEHSDPESRHGTIFTWSKDEAPGFTCPHSHCAGRRWPAFRERLAVTPSALILKPDAPLPSAETFVAREYTIGNVSTLLHQAGVFHAYEPGAGAYRERDEPAMRADLYGFLKPAMQWVNRGTKGKPELVLAPFEPNKSRVENVLDALKGISNLPKSMLPPRWLRDRRGLDPVDMISCSNGLLHAPTRTLHPPTPLFFTLNALEFAYDPNAPSPDEWKAFLNQVWKGDPESIETLQEIFGYVLTPDTRQQKIPMLVGPKRSGKGLIGRTLRRLVGEQNTCSPTLAAFDETFGKQVLVGKTLAVISDARISSRTDTAKVAETLLSISGEDPQTIARKFLPDWTGTLPVRFLIMTNELPRIGDASGALASRFIVLAMTESFYGREDPGLFNRFLPELPGILNWALEGRDRLNARGYFVQPQSANELMQEFMDLGSPEATFLRQCTRTKPGATVSQKELFIAWTSWCYENGRDKPGTSASFGRNVRAVLAWVKTRQLGGRGEQERCWEGLELLESQQLPGGEF